MYDGRRDYLRRKRDRAAEEFYRHEDRARRRDSAYDYARRRDSARDEARRRDMAMDEARRRRRDREMDEARRRKDYEMDEARGRRDSMYMPYEDHDHLDKEYVEDLEYWISKLKHKDRFKLPEHEIIKKAKDMGVTFHEYVEKEFYAIYLMMVSDYNISNEPHTYLALAKQFLEDDDIPIGPSEKVCRYLYEIVLDD